MGHGYVHSDSKQVKRCGYVVTVTEEKGQVWGVPILEARHNTTVRHPSIQTKVKPGISLPLVAHIDTSEGVSKAKSAETPRCGVTLG